MPAVIRWSQTIRAHLLRLLTRVQLAPSPGRQEGVTTIEYVLICAVLAVMVFAALKGFFGAVANKFSELTQTVSGG